MRSKYMHAVYLLVCTQICQLRIKTSGNILNQSWNLWKYLKIFCEKYLWNAHHSFWVGQDLDYWQQRLWSIVAFRSRLWTEIQGHSYYHHNHCYQGSFRSQTQILLGMRKISFGIWPDLRVADSTRTTTSPHICHFYRTQVNLGSDSWVRLSLSEWVSNVWLDLTDVTLADEDTKSKLTDDANRAIQGNEAMQVM